MKKSHTVIYVEDDSDDQLFMIEAFSHCSDHQVVVLHNAGELFSILPQHLHEVCLIVLDINLPFKNGIEIAVELKSNPAYKHLPVIFYTTGLNSPQAGQAESMGLPVFEKPVTFRGIEKLAKRLLTYCNLHP